MKILWLLLALTGATVTRFYRNGNSMRRRVTHKSGPLRYRAEMRFQLNEQLNSLQVHEPSELITPHFQMIATPNSFNIRLPNAWAAITYVEPGRFILEKGNHQACLVGQDEQEVELSDGLLCLQAGQKIKLSHGEHTAILEL